MLLDIAAEWYVFIKHSSTASELAQSASCASRAGGFQTGPGSDPEPEPEPVPESERVLYSEAHGLQGHGEGALEPPLMSTRWRY